jgi:hypothetical protein
LAVGELSKVAREEEIAELSKKYLPLKINGINDKAGLDQVHAARMDVRKRRVAIEARRKELKADALAFGKKLDQAATHLTGLLEPIESHLESEENAVKEELKRIEAEEEAKKAALVQARFDRLESLGMSVSGGMYRLPWNPEGHAMPQELVKCMVDEQFETICQKLQEEIDAEAARQAEIEAKRKADEDEKERLRKEEEARLAKIAEEQRIERERLEAIAREQKEKEEADHNEQLRLQMELEKKRKALEKEIVEKEKALEEKRKALDAEKERIANEERERKQAAERERQRIENEKLEAERLENARRDAIAKARHEMLLAVGFQYPLDDLGVITDENWAKMYDAHRAAWDEKQNAILVEKLKKEAAEKAEREAREKAKREEAARIEAARQEALRPDREKLIRFAADLECMKVPEVSEKAQVIADEIKKGIALMSRTIRRRVNEL